MNELEEITNVSKSYDGRNNVLTDVSLKLPKGKIVGLLGPNGSGKTTLIKMMNGLLQPSGGSIHIAGCPVGVESKARVAYLPDRTYLSGNRTVSEIIEFFCDFYQDFSREKAAAMLSSLDIPYSQRLKSMSKGTKEKMQLVLVMSRNADLYILDEPIAGVDPAARDYILRTILSNYNPESTVLISTHLIGDIEKVLDEVVFLRRGQIVLYTSVDNVREQHGKSVDDYFREVFAC